jgi:predicted kinase
MTMLTVYMGVPGSGKSTHARAHATGVLLSADAIRNAGADKAQHMDGLRARTSALLKSGRDVTVDACNVHTTARRMLLDIAHATHADTRLVIIEATPQQVLAAQHGRCHPVHRKKLTLYLRMWQQAKAEAARERWGETVVVDRRPSLSLGSPNGGAG